MALLNILNIGAAAFYLYLFIVVKRMKIQEREHRILELMALALFQWVISAYFVYNGGNIELLQILLPFSCIGMFFSFPLNFHFAYSVVYKRPLPVPIFTALYSIAAALSIIQFVYPFSMKLLTGPDGGIILTQAADSPINLLWLSYSLFCWLVPAYFFFLYHRRAKHNRERRQSLLLHRMIVFTIVIVVSEYYITLFVPGWNIPAQSPLLFSPWAGAMVYAIWKYGFLRISPGLLAEKILDSVEDLVLLYDIDGRMIYRNRKAAEYFGDEKISTAGGEALLKKAIAPLLRTRSSWTVDSPERQVSLLLPSHHSIPEYSNSAAVGNKALHEPVGDKNPVPPGGKREISTDPPQKRSLTINFRVKPLLDRFDDPLGVLASGSVRPEFSELTKAYRLTAREAEVLQYLMAGWTIGKTARSLNITERTVKAHIGSIYEKTGASNRIELSNILLPPRIEPQQR